ncbi:MAG: hypothetical protein KGL12_12565 [Rhodospirillales bacterium]|nr:hypothetical protein [Rhodospirillales bacterium]
MKPIVLAALGFAGLGAGTAMAAPRAVYPVVRTAGDLARLCAANPASPTGPAEVNFCHGFAQGVVMLQLEHKRSFCFPNPAPSRSATLDGFTAWVRALPAHAELPATRGLLDYLGERYPCR